MSWFALRRFSVRSYILIGIVLMTIVGTALVTERLWPGCPPGWGDAQRIELPESAGDVTLDGVLYRVGGRALLDYGLGSESRGHPLTVTADISAGSRDALGDPRFTCLRALHGSEVWAGRPTTYGTQTLADGYPPGAPSPVPNDAWRRALLDGGPEWPAGDEIGLELWLSVRGRNYVFVVPPFVLMKGL